MRDPCLRYDGLFLQQAEKSSETGAIERVNVGRKRVF
jgi:hypothetical protein